jgi:decaprenylphospho-beta-D-erythro-pentofuranosid-2-ulose 2-reductase
MQKRILILGATSAIAQATAREWANEENAQFFLVARDQAKLDAVAADLTVRGANRVECEAMDLTQLALLPALIQRAEQALNGIDIVLIAHGILGNQHAEEKDSTQAMANFQANLLSPVVLLTALTPIFMQQRYGCIAVISSVAGDRGRQSNYYYGAAKGGLTLFLQGLRNRLQPYHVNVLTIKPGFVDTPMTAAIQPKGALWAKPEAIGKGIVKAVKKQRDVVYLPSIWWLIMLIIRSIPEMVFKRLKL